MALIDASSASAVAAVIAHVVVQHGHQQRVGAEREGSDIQPRHGRVVGLLIDGTPGEIRRDLATPDGGVASDDLGDVRRTTLGEANNVAPTVSSLSTWNVVVRPVSTISANATTTPRSSSTGMPSRWAVRTMTDEQMSRSRLPSTAN